MVLISQEKSPAGNKASKSSFSKSHTNNSYKKVNELALSFLPVILQRWLPEGKIQGHEYVALNPRRIDRRMGSFKINIQNGKWSDFATPDARGGDVISLAAYLFKLTQFEAKQKIQNMLGVRNV